jgi:hypothetical protein
MTTIKITELTNIGANLATSTVIPVVNMAGTPTTEKTVLGNVANFILGGAGGSFVAAAKATSANTVTTAAQPNITSTGSLTGLTVSNANGVVNFTTTANVTLGAVANLHISGGTAGQLLSTNGNGTLSWASDTTTYGNSNVVSLLSAFGSNTITTTGNVSVGNIIGNGQALTNIAGANVSGFVPNANVANTAFAVAAANVSGLGNIATINLTGSNSNVLYGNGVFAAVAGGGNTGNVTFSDQVVMGTGSNDGSGGLYLAPGNASIANSAVQYLRVRGGDNLTHIHLDTGNNQFYDQYFGDDAKYVKLELGDTGNVVVGTDDANGNSYNWSFTSDGKLTFPGTPRIDTDANNFEVQAAEAINFEANTVVNIYTDAGNNAYQWQFGDDGNLTLPDTTGVLANVSITLEANDTGNITGLSLIGDSNANLYAHGNVTIVSDSSNTTATWSFVNTGDIVLPNDVVIGDDGSNGMMLSVPTVTPGTYSDWTFDQSGNLTLPGNTFAINYANGTKAFPNLQQVTTGGNSTNVQVAFTNGTDSVGSGSGTIVVTGGIGVSGNVQAAGELHSGGNSVVAGRLFVGPGSDLLGIVNEALTIYQEGQGYVQALILNSLANSSADWVAYGTGGTDAGGWVDMGFTGNAFNDANYTITGSGDGYVFSHGYDVGAPGGGNLVIATGHQGTTKDIIFGTNGFLTGNIFGRISHANNSLELSRTGATITFPDATEQSTAYISPSVTGNWTLASGVNTVSISVPGNGTYSLWVNGNIPNGIITYTATAVVTNTNVPVLGEQYGWYYEAGNALVLTSIPNQFVGTQGAISNAAPYSGNTANVFTFGITNNSGNTAVVNYGYTKL